MKRLATFVKEWQTVIIGIIAVGGILATYFSLPGRVGDLEAKDIIQNEATEQLQVSQKELSTTLNSAIILHKEQMKAKMRDHDRYEEQFRMLTELHTKVVNGN